MPTLFTPLPPSVVRKAPGSGGKPPVARRPTGGGGNGDDGNQPGRGPRERLYRARTFVFCALAVDLLLFTALAGFIYSRQTAIDLLSSTPHPAENLRALPPILFLNTVFLLLSCFSIEKARRQIFREFDIIEEWLGLGKPALRRAQPWIAIALAFGLLFVAGQALACKQLAAQGFAFSLWTTPADSFFFLVGVHVAHLIAGLLGMVFCLCALSRFKRVEYRQIAIDATAWYWHAIALAWLPLLVILFLGI